MSAMWRIVLLAAWLTACGRLGFDEGSVVPDAPGPDAPLVHAAPPRVLIVNLGGTLTTTMFEQFVASHATSVTDLQGELTAAALAQADLVLVGGANRMFDDTERALMTGFLQAGGTLITLTGYGSPEEFPNSLLEIVGVQFRSDDLDGPVTLLPHPATTGVDDAVFNGGRSIATLGMPPLQPIALIGTDVVGAVLEVGPGRVLAWGDEWVTYDDEWVSARSEAFWSAAFAWLWPL